MGILYFNYVKRNHCIIIYRKNTLLNFNNNIFSIHKLFTIFREIIVIKLQITKADIQKP